MHPFSTHALIRKEVRLLSPSFLIGLALTFSIWLIPRNPSGLEGVVLTLPFLLCPGMVVFMSLDSF